MPSSTRNDNLPARKILMYKFKIRLCLSPSQVYNNPLPFLPIHPTASPKRLTDQKLRSTNSCSIIQSIAGMRRILLYERA